MNLLSEDEILQITEAISDVFDTFFKDEIEIILKGDVFSRFSNFKPNEPDVKSIRGLVVWGKDKKAVSSDKTGTIDESDGYVLLSFSDAKNSGLFSDSVQIVKAGEDKLKYKGEVFKTTAIYPKANLAGDFVLLQVYFKREL